MGRTGQASSDHPVGGTATVTPGRRLVRGVAAAVLTLGAGTGAGVGCGGGDDGPVVNDYSRPTVPGARVVEIEASNFAFTPSTITASPGEELTIQMHSTGSRHDLVLRIEGQATRIVLADMAQTALGGLTAPDQPGTYVIVCTMIGHEVEGMIGSLVVA